MEKNNEQFVITLNKEELKMMKEVINNYGKMKSIMNGGHFGDGEDVYNEMCDKVYNARIVK